MAVKLHDIMSGSITFANILSIRVLEWLVIIAGKLGKLYSKRMACKRKCLATLCLSSGRHECITYMIYPLSLYYSTTGIEISMILLTTTQRCRLKLFSVYQNVAR